MGDQKYKTKTNTKTKKIRPLDRDYKTKAGMRLVLSKDSSLRSQTGRKTKIGVNVFQSRTNRWNQRASDIKVERQGRGYLE